MKNNNVIRLAAVSAVSALLVCETGCKTAPGGEAACDGANDVAVEKAKERQCVCVWRKISANTVLRDADADNRYELLRTDAGVMYRLAGTNEKEHPECCWNLSHKTCTKDGCVFVHETKKTTYVLSVSGDDRVLTLVRTQKRTFGNEPKRFLLR